MGRRWWCLALAGLVPAVALLPAQTPADFEFFEKRIRPLLASKCYACHGSKTVANAGLALDSKKGILEGGGRGTAIIPGDPAGSLLIRAVSYDDPALKMPPTGRLSDQERADLALWIERGAADPRIYAPPQSKPSGIDLAAGAKFWAFQPLRQVTPPRVRQTSWPSSDVDRFLLAALEAKSLTPSAPADRHTWIRRVSFDLTGLPPTKAEIEAFVADRSLKAYETVVDRLLASPHYGERWARHWLDLVRFAETRGHEFDPDIPDAWRYRDYVIRAFNSDLPYNELAREHLAGDLIASRRLAPDGSHWESPLGTGFWGLGEERNAADDIAQVRSDKIDNQIDVFGKAFLGLTVACARCHDHKFDPIPTADYYSLAGILESTQVTQTVIDSPARVVEAEAVHRRLEEANQRVATSLGPALRAALRDWKSYAMAAAACFARLPEPSAEEPPPNRARPEDPPCEQAGLDKARLKSWVQVLKKAAKEPDHALHPMARLARAAGSDEPFTVRASRLAEGLGKPRAERSDIVFEDFEKSDWGSWSATGAAFGPGPMRGAPSNQALTGYSGFGFANSFRGGSDRLTGVVVSKGFRLEKPFIHVRVASTRQEGRRRDPGGLAVNVVGDGRVEVITGDGDGSFAWKTIRPRKFLGQWCFIEVRDKSREGHIAVDRIVFSDHREPPLATEPDARVIGLLDKVESLEQLAARYQSLLESAVEDPGQLPLRALILPGMKPEDAFALLPESERAASAAAVAQRAEIEKSVIESQFGLVAADDVARNARVFIRGNYANQGEETPRGFLRVLGGSPELAGGSGRLELAQAMTTGRAADLFSRVMVNRIWKLHFGEGLVRSADNFGKTGEAPSHSDLLDYLARRFQQSGYSIKAMHRMLALSSAYRMSSQASPTAQRVDPENRLLQHMPIRRLEGEAIRDAMLATTGTLNRTLLGPGVAPHISEYQDGRGKPASSGPVDGNGRRSIYVQVRRNFLTPLLLAFDYPLPVQTIGRRSISTVPSQALMLMNNEFVAKQAEGWAARLVTSHPDPERRIEEMFLAAYGRTIQDAERASIREFLRSQPARYEAAAPSESRLWADVAHVIFNSKEFIFVR